MILQTVQNTWLTRNIRKITNHKGPILLHSDPLWGNNFIIKNLENKQRPLAWLALEPSDADDPVQLGNKFADALEGALGHPLVQRGLPYLYNLSIFERCYTSLGAMTIAISHVEHNPAFVSALEKMLPDESGIVLSGDADLAPQPNRLVLGSKDLILNLEDAQSIAPELASRELAQLLEQSNAALEPFLSLLHQHYNAEIPMRPDARGYWYTSGYEEQVSVSELLNTLIYKERWSEALEVAVRSAPKKVPDLLSAAGNFFLAEGLYKLLWRCLNKLSEADQDNETILFWLLTAARRNGKAATLSKRIEQFLELNEAPELRAYYSSLNTNKEMRLKETKKAVQLAKTPFTLFQLGLACSYTDLAQAISVLHEAVESAEAQNDDYATVRNAWALSATYILKGQYEESTHWSQWALEVFDARGLRNTYRWLLTVNEWAFGRILTGRTAGLEDLLSEAETQLSQTTPGLATLLRSTLGDYWLSQGQAEKAHHYYESMMQAPSRSKLGDYTVNIVRALIEQNKIEEAQRAAQHAYHLATDRAAADLAQGMVYCFTNTENAKPYLERAAKQYLNPLNALPYARACLHLAFCYFKLGNSAKAQEILEKARPYIKQLSTSGYRYLVGPDEQFKPLLNDKEQKAQLSVALLGRAEIRLNSKNLTLTERQVEVLALLILYPKGLTGDQLAYHLYGDKATAASVKSLVARLREHLPIATRPYRLNIEVEADFTQLDKLLSQAEVSRAASLYKGTFLANTASPRLLEEQRYLEEALREAVIGQKDTSALYHLCIVLKNDMGLWQTLLTLLSKSDPRYPSVLSRTVQLKKTWGLS